MMHMKAVHPKPIKETDLEEEDISGKRKIESVVDRLAHDPKGNTIRTSAGFMVVAKDGEHGEELSEDQIKLKKRKLSERLQDPIKVKDRSHQVNVHRCCWALTPILYSC